MLVTWEGINHYPGVHCRGAFEQGAGNNPCGGQLSRSGTLMTLHVLKVCCVCNLWGLIKYIDVI